MKLFRQVLTAAVVAVVLLGIIPDASTAGARALRRWKTPKKAKSTPTRKTLVEHVKESDYVIMGDLANWTSGSIAGMGRGYSIATLIVEKNLKGKVPGESTDIFWGNWSIPGPAPDVDDVAHPVSSDCRRIWFLKKPDPKALKKWLKVNSAVKMGPDACCVIGIRRVHMRDIIETVIKTGKGPVPKPLKGLAAEPLTRGDYFPQVEKIPAGGGTPDKECLQILLEILSDESQVAAVLTFKNTGQKEIKISRGFSGSSGYSPVEGLVLTLKYAGSSNRHEMFIPCRSGGRGAEYLKKDSYWAIPAGCARRTGRIVITGYILREMYKCGKGSLQVKYKRTTSSNVVEADFNFSALKEKQAARELKNKVTSLAGEITDIYRKNRYSYDYSDILGEYVKNVRKLNNWNQNKHCLRNLITLLKVSTSESTRVAAVRYLKDLTDQDLGDNWKKWDEWLKKLGTGRGLRFKRK